MYTRILMNYRFVNGLGSSFPIQKPFLCSSTFSSERPLNYRSLSMYTRFKDELNKQIRNDKQFQEHLKELENKRKDIEQTRGFKRIKVSHQSL
jgi:hypothetical protein